MFLREEFDLEWRQREITERELVFGVVQFPLQGWGHSVEAADTASQEQGWKAQSWTKYKKHKAHNKVFDPWGGV